MPSPWAVNGHKMARDKFKMRRVFGAWCQGVWCQGVWCLVPSGRVLQTTQHSRSTRGKSMTTQRSRRTAGGSKRCGLGLPRSPIPTPIHPWVLAGQTSPWRAARGSPRSPYCVLCKREVAPGQAEQSQIVASANHEKRKLPQHITNGNRERGNLTQQLTSLR